MNRKWVLWILATLITLASVYYQRKTGPTYPESGKVEINGENISYDLIRSYNKKKDAPVVLEVPEKSITGSFIYRRTPSHDQWTEKDMIREGKNLVAYLPHQPPAGKIEYQITLSDKNSTVKITQEPVVIRFRGDVPAYVLIPHIILMFAAMLLGTRAGLAALVKHKTYILSLLTIITLFLGGLFLGPVVQKFAFDAYWTGWPMGTDLTDNKTAVAFIFWLIALFFTTRNRKHRTWVIVASTVLLLIYLIPHSMMGSEIDHTADSVVHRDDYKIHILK